MSTHKYFDRFCWGILAAVLLLTALLFSFSACLPQQETAELGYENRLFDTSRVHSIDIIMDDWEGFLEDCTSEEYTNCTVLIDGETYKNVGIRAKGNTSLSQVQIYGNDRYSFKLEFDHYDSGNTYHGLDKLCLNNLIQDNTYMKDYLTYQLMGQFGVASPLCSYADISVNGDTWGLYLAVEGVEESFLTRNYGKDYGSLYKPDSMNMGARSGLGPGGGKDFEFDGSPNKDNTNNDNAGDPEAAAKPEMTDKPEAAAKPEMTNGPGMMDNKPSDTVTKGGISSMGAIGAMGFRDRQNSDTLLTYTDDDPDSYSNIFDNAKTPVTAADKTRLINALSTLNNSDTPENALDSEAVLRYFVVHNFVLNFDSYTGSLIHNYYLYEKDGKLSMIPWDYNLAFGAFQSADGNTKSLANYPIDTPVSGQSTDSRPMLAWIFRDSSATERYHRLFEEFIADYFDGKAFSKLLNDTAAMIAPYVEADPTKFCTYDEFLAGVETLDAFCQLRAESIAKQLDKTIGSTAEAQAQNPNALLDTGDIQISDTGSMNMGHGPGRDNQMPQPPNFEGQGEMPQPPDFEGQNEMPQRNGKGNMPPNAVDPAYDPASLFWLIASVGLLLLGLLFAFRFNRRSKH